MRRILTLTVGLAALAQGTLAPVAIAQQTSRPQGIPVRFEGQGLCRNTPTLMAMPPEQVSTNQGNRWESRRRGGARPGPMAVPAPPAAPPSPVMRAPEVATEAAASAAAADTMVVTGSRIGAARAEPSVIGPMPPDRRRPQPPPQAGQLTAGEHDDLLNPRLYQRYVDQFLASETISGVPRVDTGKVLTVVVQDSRGQPMPFATVTLTCADGNTFSLTSQADGRVVFFPDLDRLGASVTMTAQIGNGNRPSVPRQINLADVRGAQTVMARVNGQAQAVRKFDLALVIDTTGSMGDELEYVKSELRDIVGALRRRHPGLDIRISAIMYRDQGDEYVTRTFAFTNDVNSIQSHLSAQSANGGGDYPEAMEVAMNRAVAMNWRPDAAKSILLVADAPPHGEDVAATWNAAEVARGKRISIVPVAASGVGDAAQYIMRAMAAATQSRYLFLTDDSGIGNPHAEPSVDCYHVTRLDALVRRVLDSQISGRRIEPEASEIIRTVGDYDNGRCRLPD